MNLEHESIAQYMSKVNLELRENASYTKYNLEIKSEFVAYQRTSWVSTSKDLAL